MPGLLACWLPHAGGSVRTREGGAISRGRNEGLLNRAGADPTQHICHRAGLIVSTAGSRSAKRLLPDNSPRGFVVDVEVPRRIAQCRSRLIDRLPVVGEDRTR